MKDRMTVITYLKALAVGLVIVCLMILADTAGRLFL